MVASLHYEAGTRHNISGQNRHSASETFSEGIARMITVKIFIALVCTLIALDLLLTFAPNFCDDFALAVMACLS